MKRRGRGGLLPTLAAVGGLLAAGCSASSHYSGGQQAFLFAGAFGGKDPASIYGQAIAMTADDAGDVYLLTDDITAKTLWRFTPEGVAVSRELEIPEYAGTDVAQMAADRSGRVWLAASDALLAIDTSGTVTGLGVTADAADDAVVPDGVPQSGSDVTGFTGVAVAGDGTVYYAKELGIGLPPQIMALDPQGATRTVLDQKLPAGAVPKDGLGKPCGSVPIDPGGKFVSVTACQLAVGADGDLLMAGAGGVWRVRPDSGSAPVQIAGQGSLFAEKATAPFTQVGKSADLHFDLGRTSAGDLPGIALDGHGAIYAKTSSVTSGTTTLGPAFAWNVVGSDKATSKLRKLQWTAPQLYPYENPDAIAQIRPDGTAAAATLGGAVFTASGDSLYVAVFEPLGYPHSGNLVVLRIPVGVAE